MHTHTHTSWALYRGCRSPAEQGDPAPPVVKLTLPLLPRHPPTPPPTATASPSLPCALPPMSSAPGRARLLWEGPGRTMTHTGPELGSCCTGSERTPQTCPYLLLEQTGYGAGGDRWVWSLNGRTRSARGQRQNSCFLHRGLLLPLLLHHSQHCWCLQRSPIYRALKQHGGFPGWGLRAGCWCGSCLVPDSQSESQWCDRKESRSLSGLIAPVYPRWSSAALLWWRLKSKQHRETETDFNLFVLNTTYYLTQIIWHLLCGFSAAFIQSNL